MEQITPEQKKPVVKALAVGGLIGIIILIAWLSVQIVQVLPSALNSLASLANSVYNYNPNVTREIELSSNQTLVNANEPVTISWKALDIPGSYTFSFVCAPGLSLDISTDKKEFAELTCDKTYELDSATSAEITVDTTNERFTELNYNISFFRTNSTSPAASKDGNLTVVNGAIELTGGTATTTATSTVVTEEPVVPAKPATTTVVVTEEVKPTTPKPVVVPKPVIVSTPIYSIPVSIATGTTDLVNTYIGIGKMTNGTLNNTGVVYYNQAGTMQFMVHNTGTKTSESWTFEAKLPGDISFTSETQKPLLPNERAYISLGFPAQTETTPQNISVTVKTSRETNTNNNRITQSVLVLK